MKNTTILFMLLIPLELYGQEKSGIIYPGKFLINKTGDTLFYMPKEKLETIMKREETYRNLAESLKEKNGLNDSLINLKTQEADGWYRKLIETDTLLEQAEVKRETEMVRVRRKNKIWFGVGVGIGILVGVGF